MHINKIYFLIENEWNGRRYNNPSEVVKLCDEALLIEPKSILVLYHKGLAYLSFTTNIRENTFKAKECFKEVVNKSPQFWRAWHYLGICNELQGDQFLTNALYCYSKARAYERIEKNINNNK